MDIKQKKFSTWQQIKEAVKSFVTPVENTAPKVVQSAPTVTPEVEPVSSTEETSAPKAAKKVRNIEE